MDTKPSRLDKCLSLRFWRDDEWCPLPAWAQFFIRIGWRLRSENSGESRRTVAAVCVPHRAFSASFAALGSVLQEPLPTPSPEDIKRHFEVLLNLPDPAQRPVALTYFRNGRKFHGMFDGVDKNYPNRIRIRVQARYADKSGAGTFVVGDSDAINIQIEPDEKPVLNSKSAGIALITHADFVSSFYSQSEIHLLHIAAKCHVSVVGRMNTMREETTKLRYAIPDGHQSENSGVLNDLLRIRKFSSTASIARTSIYPAQRSAGPHSSDRETVRLAIFDGSEAFIKWGTCFPHANILVILDRTEHAFQEGLSQLNSRYYTRTDDYALGTDTSIPTSVDSIGFVECF